MDRDEAGPRCGLSEREVKRRRGEAEGAEWSAVVRSGGRGTGQSGAAEEGLRGVQGKVTGEITVGVGPEIQDQVESRELSSQVGRKWIERVKCAPTCVMLGMNAVDQAGVEGEGGGGGVAGEFDI